MANLIEQFRQLLAEGVKTIHIPLFPSVTIEIGDVIAELEVAERLRARNERLLVELTSLLDAFEP